MVENPFLPLSFIAGPAILTNASTVMLNGASIRYNLAIGLWRDLQSELHGHSTVTVAAYTDHELALSLAHKRIVFIVRALNLLYCAVGGFGLSTLTGLAGALMAENDAWAVSLAKTATLLAGGFALVCLLAAAATFTMESRCTLGLLRLGTPKLKAFQLAQRANEGG